MILTPVPPPQKLIVLRTLTIAVPLLIIGRILWVIGRRWIRDRRHNSHADVRSAYSRSSSVTSPAFALDLAAEMDEEDRRRNDRQQQQRELAENGGGESPQLTSRPDAETEGVNLSGSRPIEAANNSPVSAARSQP